MKERYLNLGGIDGKFGHYLFDGFAYLFVPFILSTALLAIRRIVDSGTSKKEEIEQAMKEIKVCKKWLRTIRKGVVLWGKTEFRIADLDFINVVMPLCLTAAQEQIILQRVDRSIYLLNRFLSKKFLSQRLRLELEEKLLTIAELYSRYNSQKIAQIYGL